MLFKPGIMVGALSGKLGAHVASHNKGGQYFKGNAIPTNPNTPEQQAVRGSLAALSNTWVNTLTASNRSSWEAYAAAVPLANRVGDPRPVPPLAMFVRTNTVVLQAGFPVVPQAPGVFDLGTFTPPSVTAVATSGATVAFETGDTWNLAQPGFLAVYASRPQNRTVNFFKGPFQFAVAIAGEGGSPITIPIPFTAAAGQRQFFAFRGCTADGRLSGQTTAQFDRP